MFRGGVTPVVLVILTLGLAACDELETRYGSRYELKQDARGRTIRLDKRTGEVVVIQGGKLVPIELANQQDLLPPPAPPPPRPSPQILWTRQDEHPDWLPPGQILIGKWEPTESFASEGDCRSRLLQYYLPAAGGGWFRNLNGGGQVLAICLPENVKPPAK